MQTGTTAIATRLEQQLDFLNELDRLKSVYRASKLTQEDRHENSAEHSWHIAMFALVLSEHSNEKVDQWRVIMMLLLHDIVEIDTEDLPLHAPQDPDRAAKEQTAAERLFGFLPEDQAVAFLRLWEEFERGDSADAVFARSIDRLQPIIQNSLTSGGTWPDYDVTESQMYTRTGHIQLGSEKLWGVATNIFKRALKAGWLKQD